MPGQGRDAAVAYAMPHAALERLEATLANPHAAMDRIGRYIVASTLRRFERERAPDGTPWLKSARAIADGGRTLTDTGRLRGSITHAVMDAGHTVEIGSNVVYAAIHQFGGRTGRGRRVTIPARSYLGIDGRDRDAITRILARALQGAAP